jgi:hypothetical protein
MAGMAQESLEERGRQAAHFFALQREQLRSQISFELELSSEESDDDSDVEEGVLSSFTMHLHRETQVHVKSWQQPSQKPTGRAASGRNDKPWLTMPPGEFEEMTGFNPQHFVEAAALFKKVPKKIVTKRRNAASRELVLTIMLMRWRMKETRTWNHVAKVLNINRSIVNDLYMEGIKRIFEVKDYRVLSTHIDMPRVYKMLEDMTDAVELKGGLVEGVIGLLDGTGRATCRPSAQAGKRKFDHYDMQRLCFNGHYGGHGTKVQFVTLFDSITTIWVELMSQHDSHTLACSKIEAQLRAVTLPGHTQHPKLYGDPAYSRSDVIERKGKGVRDDKQTQLDDSMIPIRAMVEDSIGGFGNVFPFFDNGARKLHQLLRKSRVSYKQEIIVSNLFLNLRCCAYGNQVSSYFTCIPPPSMEAYMHNANSGLLVRYLEAVPGCDGDCI